MSLPCQGGQCKICMSMMPRDRVGGPRLQRHSQRSAINTCATSSTRPGTRRRHDGHRHPVAVSGVSRAQSGLLRRRHRCGALAVPSRATCAHHRRMPCSRARHACTVGGVSRPRPRAGSWPGTPPTRHGGLGTRNAQPWASSASGPRPAAAPGFLHRSSRLCHARSPRLWRPTPGGASGPPRGCYKTPRRSPDGVYRRASR